MICSQTSVHVMEEQYQTHPWKPRGYYSSLDNAIFLGESLLQELESAWELTLSEPVPEVVKFRPISEGQYRIVSASSPGVSKDASNTACNSNNKYTSTELHYFTVSQEGH